MKGSYDTFLPGGGGGELSPHDTTSYAYIKGILKLNWKLRVIYTEVKKVNFSYCRSYKLKEEWKSIPSINTRRPSIGSGRNVITTIHAKSNLKQIIQMVNNSKGVVIVTYSGSCGYQTTVLLAPLTKWVNVTSALKKLTQLGRK